MSLITDPNDALSAVIRTMQPPPLDADEARLQNIVSRVQLAGADFMIEFQRAETWGALAVTLAELERCLEFLSAIRDSGIEREKVLAQP